MSERMALQHGFLSRLGDRVRAPLIGTFDAEHGQSVVELALLLPVLALLLLGVIDFGRAYYLSIEVSNAAYAGALYGMTNPSDSTGMTDAAKNDAKDISGGASWSAPVITYGCECSDFTKQTAAATCETTPPTCTSPATVVNYVQVKTSYTYNTMFPWPGIPSSFTLNGNARMRSSQ